jgi:hypothetical protein
MNSTIVLPTHLYQNLAQKSRQLHRQPDELVIELVEQYLQKPELSTPNGEGNYPVLPEGTQEEIDLLETFDQEKLLEKSHLTANPDMEKRFQELAFKRQAEGLSQEEEEEIWQLGSEFNRILLLRARAAELLHQRGYDIKTLYQNVSPQ